MDRFSFVCMFEWVRAILFLFVLMSVCLSFLGFIMVATCGAVFIIIVVVVNLFVAIGQPLVFVN